MDKKDLIIGGASGYNWSQLKYWVRSIKETGFTGDVVLCVSNIDDQTINKLSNEGVRLIVYERNYNMAPHVIRFFSIWDFLNEHKDRYHNVIVTDTRDVIFQKNPSNWLDGKGASFPYRPIVVSSEGLLYKDEPWGDNNLRQALGSFFHTHYREKMIYNVGVIAGHYSHVKDLILMLFELSMNRPIDICDQAMFNFMINNEPYLSSIYPTDNKNNWAVQLGTTAGAVSAGSGDLGKSGNLDHYLKVYQDEQPIIRDDLVYNPSNQLYAIVHQWDRIPLLKSAIEKKYEHV